MLFAVPLLALASPAAGGPAGGALDVGADSLWALSTCVFGAVVFSVDVRVMLMTRHWTPVVVLGNALSLASFFWLTLWYDGLDATDPWNQYAYLTTIGAQQAATKLFGTTAFWLLCALAVGTLSAGQLAAMAARELLPERPDPIHLLRQQSLAWCQRAAAELAAGGGGEAAPGAAGGGGDAARS